MKFAKFNPNLFQGRTDGILLGREEPKGKSHLTFFANWQPVGNYPFLLTFRDASEELPFPLRFNPASSDANFEKAER